MAEITKMYFSESYMTFNIEGIDAYKESFEKEFEGISFNNSVELEYSLERSNVEYPTGGHGDDISYSEGSSIDDSTLVGITINDAKIEDEEKLSELLDFFNRILSEESQMTVDQFIENMSDYDDFTPEPPEPDYD